MRKFALVAAGATAALWFAFASASSGLRAETVKVDKFDFTPRTVSIGQGQRVTWKNKEGRHSVTFRTDPFDKVIRGNEEVSKRFRKTGTFRYFCRFHDYQGMKGKVTVGDV
jgi:plastocyanin